MCGIIAVLRRRSDRKPPEAHTLLALLEGGALEITSAGDEAFAATVSGVAVHVEEVNRLLRGTPGVLALLGDPSLTAKLDAMLTEAGQALADRESLLDAGASDPVGLESVNAAVIRLKDALWAVQHDRIPTARAVADLAGSGQGRAAIEAFTSVQAALSAIDRLEVRGRDSAGLTLLVRNHGLDLTEPAVRAMAGGRLGDPLFTAGAIRITPEGHLSFVYKAAAEIGELGDNTRALRRAIKDDDMLQRALVASEAEASVLGHTRWASIGIISEPNAHPMNSDEVGLDQGPYVTASLNGDVDNFADLKVSDGLRIANEITSDAKVIPTLVSRRIAAGEEPVEAFRQSVRRFDGSVAIAAVSSDAPNRIQLALRGSGQALYVGIDEDVYIVASEPYGVVEDASRYLRLDGDTPADPTDPSGSRGQVVELDGDLAGTVSGIRRFAYDGSPLPVTEQEMISPEVTTRDINRGSYQHFLLK
ncbi:MAG: hypothetical protein ABIP03_04230 [Aquihabitans sp.]